LNHLRKKFDVQRFRVLRCAISPATLVFASQPAIPDLLQLLNLRILQQILLPGFKERPERTSSFARRL